MKKITNPRLYEFFRRIGHRYTRFKHLARYYVGLEEYRDWFNCFGLTSTVYEHGGCIGHVIFIDAEDCKLEELENEINEHFDVYFIYKSSHDGYHVMCPRIMDYEDAYSKLQELDVEHSKHTEIGYKRGDWVLRTTDKRHKPRPVYIKGVAKHNREHVYSKPHLEYIRHYEDEQTPENVLELMKTRGHDTDVVMYGTFK